MVVENLLEEPIDKSAGYIGLDSLPVGKSCVLEHICADNDEYARLLFAFFRECEERGLTTIYCQQPSTDGVGMAIADRLSRAASATSSLSSTSR